MAQVRHAINPDDFKRYTTEEVRKALFIGDLFKDDEVSITYTHYDRMIVGGAAPVKQKLLLKTFTELKASYFLERRELGIFNVGADSAVSVDGQKIELRYKEAIYIGRGVKEVHFHPSENGKALFYFNSAPAHTSYPTRKVTSAEADTAALGDVTTANQRTIRKLLVSSVLPTCQLQMGMTELQTGSVWNTMPPHTHDRRMEVYFYFEIPNGQTACHFLGAPDETRHVWMQNNQAVLSPPWSIHCGAGTSNYTFIWSMAGENLDYGDMDQVKPTELR